MTRSEKAADGECRESHIGEGGLWIPPALREFTSQVVFRTPRSTIQHFQSGGGELDPYYGLIDESHFGPAESFRDPKNPELAPDQVSIKPQGDDPVVLNVEVAPDVRCDGGVSQRPKGWGCPECYRSKADYVAGVEVPDECPECGNGDLETWDSEPPEASREITPMDRRWR